jgi:SAM-dependent methyltransferase
MSFHNAYDDSKRAEAYATLEFPGTYWLAFRDLPAIIAEHVGGRKALDFGCGAGRSTRFLKQLGFDATGIDISASMIARAKAADPGGVYRLIADGDFSALGSARFDLILSAFAFDNIHGVERRRALLRGLGRLLNAEGRIVLLNSAPEIYVHEWVSFTTKDFPENRRARSGDAVRIVMKDVDDRRPVLDFFSTHDDYMNLFDESGLDLVARYRPRGRKGEPHDWLTETTVSPWFIFVLTAKG